MDVRDEACLVSEELGADSAINASSGDPVQEIRDATGGNGADVVFECAGEARVKGWPDRVLWARRSSPCGLGEASGGLLVRAPLEIDVDGLRERSLRLIFPNSSSLAHLEHTVRLVASGRIRLGPMLTISCRGSSPCERRSKSRRTRPSTGDQPSPGIDGS